MATLSKGITYGATETLTNIKLHNLVDLGSVSNIVNVDIDAAAGIVDTKLAQITTLNKVSGSAIGLLASIPSGAGLLPTANIPFTSFPSLASIPNYALNPLTLASWVDGSAMRNIQSMPSLAGQLAWYSVTSSLASGALPMFDGVSKLIGSPPISAKQVFTSSGTFIAPAGVTRILITMAGGGGGGQAGTAGGSIGGDAGGGAGAVINYPYVVTPGNSYTVTVGTGGAGGTGITGTHGADGLNSSFAGGAYTITCSKGIGSATRTGGTVSVTNGATLNTAITTGGNGTAKSSPSGGMGGYTAFGFGGVTGSAGVDGTPGTFGGGGGGGYGTGSGTATNGGNGGDGICIVQY